MTDTRPAPYPADTRAKGWRFELDLERVEQSDTWALAAPDVRPWLFLLWAKAWQQVPCGSLPADDELVAARIGMAPKAFSKVRHVLMRGWWLADDGRLYHDVIAIRVTAMLDAKRKESDRKAAYRARMDAERQSSPVGVPPMSHGTDAGQTQESRGIDPGCDATGTSTGTGTRRIEEEKGARKRAPSFDAEGIELPEWLDRELWAEWTKERRQRGKAITERAAREQLRSLDEYRRNGHTPERVIRHAIASGNQGLFPPPVLRGAQAITEHRVVETWKPPPPLTPEERAASNRAKEIALASIKVINRSAA